MIQLDLEAPRTLAAANAHYYKEPTEERYLDRVLKYHDLIFMTDGAWSITELQNEYPLEKNDVLFLAAGRHHYTKRPCLPGTRTFCLHLTTAAGDSENNPAGIRLPTHMHPKHPERIRQYFSDLVSAYWSEDLYKEKKIRALLSLLLLALADECREHSESEESLAERAIRMISDSPHHRYGTEEMAALLHVSPRTLNNAMHKKIGLPFYSYEKKVKLEMAATQLKMEPELKLAQIAAAFGFHDEFHLSKAFKQKFGVSPSEYRSLPGEN